MRVTVELIKRSFFSFYLNIVVVTVYFIFKMFVYYLYREINFRGRFCYHLVYVDGYSQTPIIRVSAGP